MKHLNSGVVVSALMAGCWAGGAAADLTAEEAWTSLRDVMTASGYATAGTQSRTGNRLDVSGVSFDMALEDPPGMARIDLGTLGFVEQGDGSVAVEMPEVIPFKMEFEVEPGKMMTMGYNVVQSGATMVLSGSVENLEQNYTADRIEASIDELVIPDEAMGPDMVKMAFAMSGVTSSTKIGGGTPRPMEFAATAADLTYDVSAEAPGEGAFSMKGGFQNLTFDGGGMLPVGVQSSDFLSMLQAGYAINGTFAHGGGSTAIAGEEEGNAFSADSKSSAGSLSVSANSKSLTYGLSQQGTAITIQSPDLPFPVEMNMRATEAGLTVPLMEGADPQDFALRVNLADFSISDVIWSMFDPGSVLPRDPATLLLDLTGKATVLANFLDPEVAADLENSGAMPAELNALDVKGLHVKLAGAELTGMGGFTFDNADLQSFGGMPRPTGALDLSLTGANTLIDRLQQLGFIGQEEAGGARMMMGLLAVPGDGPDSLKSRIEVNEQGHILANGQRIQ